MPLTRPRSLRAAKRRLQRPEKPLSIGCVLKYAVPLPLFLVAEDLVEIFGGGVGCLGGLLLLAN